LENLRKHLSKGVYVKSSGTTGTPKNIFRTPENLKHCNRIAVDSQKITKDSNIYTVCKMDHAGGMLAQTLPAVSVGANVTVEDFSPKRFMSEIHKYTHTHLTPRQAIIIKNTKDFTKIDLTGIWITCGSDIVSYELIKSYVKQGATFMTNWGMSEIGPCAINTVFNNLEYVERHQEWAPKGLPMLGENIYCNYQIDYLTNELLVKGDMCIYDDWFNTGDLVELKYKVPPLGYFAVLYYAGRL
jgi:acyl-CoA synthetase (AMP-forming)/AMP-acid ligase II